MDHFKKWNYRNVAIKKFYVWNNSDISIINTNREMSINKQPIMRLLTIYYSLMRSYSNHILRYDAV